MPGTADRTLQANLATDALATWRVDEEQRGTRHCESAGARGDERALAQKPASRNRCVAPALQGEAACWPIAARTAPTEVVKVAG